MQKTSPESKLTNPSTWKIRLANSNERIRVQQFHVPNHIKETAHSESERIHQTNDLPTDFPQLYNQAEFQATETFIAETQAGQIVGCIGVAHRSQYTEINIFSVRADHRGKGIGRQLFARALQRAKQLGKPIRLVTLDNHSQGIPITVAAKKIYYLNGFKVIKSQAVAHGDNQVDVLTMERAC